MADHLHCNTCGLDGASELFVGQRGTLCLACHRKRQRAWRAASGKTYSRRNWRTPEKSRAHNAVQYALATGRLTKPSECERCGEAADLIDGHHEDYSRPLDVVWLCRRCHVRTHLTEEEAAAAHTRSAA